MKVGKLLAVFFSVVLLFTVTSNNASAAIFTGHSSTIVDWFGTPDDDTAIPVYEYLLLNVLDIDKKGMNFKGYGRFATDTQDLVDVDSQLYYAFLEKSGLFDDKLDFKLGRQFLVTTAGASVMDGLDLVLKNIGPYTFRLFGGGNATYYEDYDLADDLIWGAEATGSFLDKSLTLGLSYIQTWNDSDLTKELIGIDFEYDRENLIDVYSELQLNYINNVVSYFLFGGKYYKSPKWNLRAEYLYSLPVFPSTSIYSVFAVDKYQEVMAEYTYNIAVGLRAFGIYTHEFYEEYSDANVFEAGIEKIRTKRFSGYLTGVYRDDDEGQNLWGFKARVAWLFTKKLQAGVGANVDVLDRRIDVEDNIDETTSNLFWVYGTYFITDRINFQLKFERGSSDLWDEYYQGRARLNVSF